MSGSQILIGDRPPITILSGSSYISYKSPVLASDKDLGFVLAGNVIRGVRCEYVSLDCIDWYDRMDIWVENAALLFKNSSFSLLYSYIL